MFVGSGMGVATVTAARILKGQLEGHSGEEYKLAIDKFPQTGITKVTQEVCFNKLCSVYLYIS